MTMSEFLSLMEQADGLKPVRSMNVNEAALARVQALIMNEAGHSTRKQAYLLEEAVATGDFPTLFGALIDRELLSAYKAYVPDWRSYVKVGSVPNFNTHEFHKVVGQDDVLPQVAELGPYLEEASVTGHYDRRVFKWGRRFGISWESLINDSMGAFSDIVQRFYTAVQRTEARNATLGFCSAAGPSTALFGAPIADPADGQNVTNQGVLPLTITNLGTTLQLMARQTDVNGEIIAVEGVHLVVPKSLEMTARQILTSAQMQQVDSAAGANAAVATFIPLPTSNVLPQMGIKLHVNSLLEAIDVSGTGDTTWYVFADPSQGVSVGLDYLRGHEAPEVCMKASDKVSVGGGAIGVMEGSFEDDSIAYRVRTVHGHWHGDPRFAYAQVAP
jgi:hypothetical protein